MICPNCKKEISRVRVYSEAWQWGELEGNSIVSYGSCEELLETVSIKCPECSEELIDVVEG